MNCQEIYRKNLIRDINLQFKIIIVNPLEDPVHDFRVGVKRLTAFYFYLQYVNAQVNSKEILKPYRALFKSIGKVRDLQITKNLCLELGASRNFMRKLDSLIRVEYNLFSQQVAASGISRIRVPTIDHLKVSQTQILRSKKPYLTSILERIVEVANRMTVRAWHKKRILLKRYHHTLDAFQYCPGHELDEEELKQIKMLEQLLGDWHDRVVAVNLIQASVSQKDGSLIAELKKQERSLVSSARIYLDRYKYWLTQN